MDNTYNIYRDYLERDPARWEYLTSLEYDPNRQFDMMIAAVLFVAFVVLRQVHLLRGALALRYAN
ncbi:hypothetical protein LY78DRAFT_273965 [Colletotrichum sublineola]|nr:hypothetical protein LY78DRAFT_273965 [Colletotrichum sublineola]